jgi:imidazolonepropionase-like amidohydrolase
MATAACDGDPAEADAGTDADAFEDGGDADAEGASDAEAPEPGLYLRGATIITAASDTALTGRAVAVRGARIESVDPETGDPPAGLEPIDLDGATLLPGFIDAHVHVAGRDDDVQVPLDLFLDFGVTGVRDLVSPLDRILELRDAIDAGRVVGPRIATCGPAFTAPGGHPISTLWGNDPWLIENAARIPLDPEEARAEVRLLAEAGVDLVKVMVTACGWLEDGSCPRIDLVVLDAVVDEAHALGLVVAAHTDTREDIVDALGAGVDSIEHGLTAGELDDDLVALIVDSGAYLVPTISTVRSYAPATLDELIARLARLRQAGARIAVGTDSSRGTFAATFGASFPHEIEYMVQAGFTPMEAIVTATAVNAELLGWSADTGTIEPGKIADLVAVAGDPLEDLEALYDVQLVVRDGVVVRSGGRQ